MCSGQNHVGWLPQYAKSGDSPANIWRDEVEPGLLLRLVNNTAIFQIIGIYMLQRGAFAGDSSVLPKNQHMSLHFDPIDLLVFVAQYCFDNDEAATQAQIAKTFLQNCKARITRSAFSSYGVLHSKPEPY